MTQFIMPMPEGFSAQLEAQQEMQHLQQHEEATRIHRFIEEMTPDNLVTFMDVLKGIFQSHSADASAHYYYGICVSTMRTKHDLCPCGKNHVQEMVDAHAESEEERRIRENYEKYGLTLTGNGSEAKCNNCGQTYVSLADRMLRPPGIDGCGGCQIRSAHG